MSRIDSPFPRKPLSWPQIYLGVSLTTLATLLLELSLTRIFSVVFYYHFAFLAISIALFGLGAGGVVSYAIVGKGGNVFSILGRLSTVNALLVPAALIFLLTRTGGFTNVTLAVIYFATALPFVLAGAIVSMAISETIERIEQVYFFDLMGAAAGCLLLVPFLSNLGGPNTVIAAAVLFAAAGAVWFHVEGRIQGRAAAVLIGLGLTALVVVNIKQPVVEVKYAKDQQLPKEVFTKWNEFSRIAVNEQGWIVIDADANTWLSTYDVDNMTKEAVSDLMSEGPGLPYRLKRGGKTLIIGAGGGKDVARALASGSRDVTAVEINPIIATTIMREKFVDKNHGLYNRKDVRVNGESIRDKLLW